MDFLTLRKKIIEKDFSRMNDMQFKAVVTTEGPLLVLAGAGSGKTTVLVNRIAYLVKYGNAYFDDNIPHYTEDDINEGMAYLRGEASHPGRVFSSRPAAPWEILAITFTNKAAGELKNRIAAILGEQSDVWAGTFHSVCAKILRFSGDRLGYTSSFTIYDTDDQKSVIKDILKTMKISEKELPVKLIAGEISRAKESFMGPSEYLSSAPSNHARELIAKVFAEYIKRLKNANAMDFDDLIINTVTLFEQNPDVLSKYSQRFRYIMVDEYQDTNYAQYRLISLLAGHHKNLCVVGDDDQSIYSFRGATIENILNFERQFPGAQVIRLEQNYRSTKTILRAANAIISNNRGRKGKELWTDREEDCDITVATLESEQGEARYVAERVLGDVADGAAFSSHAVLYRMNAQSNSIENVFARSGIPYRIIGGHRFFDRKEIKDVMSYLAVINNPADGVRLKRIINQPRRGIGDTSLAKAEEIASGLGISLFEVLKEAENYPALSRTAARAKEFCQLIDILREQAENVTLHELLELTLDKSGYMDMLRSEGDTSVERIENVNELLSSIVQYENDNSDAYENDNSDATLAGFLEEVALISDIDNYDENSDVVTLMTLHAAKGLEFDTVFLVGMEEDIFPGSQSIYGGEAAMEEERRLCYVGVTRARKKLYITNAYSRLLFGFTRRNRPSRFIAEIPGDCCTVKGYSPFSAGGSWEGSPDGSYGGFGDNGFAGRGYGQGAWADNGGYSRAKSGFGRSADGNFKIGGSSFKPASKPKSAPAKTYTVGSSVRHNVFGEGVILNATPMGGDTLLEISFEKVGTKKIMANFAKLEQL